MSWLSRFGVAQKISGGFAAMAIVIIATVITTIFSVVENQTINQRVFDLRLPTVLNTAKMVDNINYSLAALRGYMILGNDQFKVQRAEAWKNIREHEKKMEQFSKNWTNPENVKRLREISRRLDIFEAAQTEVENISHTVDETPASKILLEEAAPRAAIIVQEITNMINLEASQPATTERKALLGMMADVRGSMGMSLANIRAYLLTGDPDFRKEFDNFWGTNERRFNNLADNTRLLTPEQLRSFNRLKSTREEFSPLPPAMFDLRASDKWNMANYLLGTNAAPEASEILKLLRAMESNQEVLANSDVALAKNQADSLLIELIVVGVIALAIAIFVSVIITRMVVVPVREVASGLRAIAQGDLRQKFSSKSHDELGDMIRDLNGMSDSLSDIVGSIVNYSESVSSAAEQISNGNLDLSQRTEEQASALEQTASSIEEMTSTIKGNADSA
ncbi:MAG: MCP four helix bundle domain-containing protein, partial [Gammaproteobacteria bacterium]|nr:MCP four helix bundle domain-containing protein [Gammaproteobacteria bacterium]